MRGEYGREAHKDVQRSAKPKEAGPNPAPPSIGLQTGAEMIYLLRIINS